MSNLPTFVIVGAMKSATTSLQEQLIQQPGIFMCEPKEPNFFSDDAQYAKGIEWYTGLFSKAPANTILGEASTHYTKLPTHPHSVSRLKQILPNAKFIYVMRHPIDRLISHYIHEWSMGVYRCSLNDAIAHYPELIAYGQYAMQLEPFFDAFGRDAVLPVFFDRLINDPQAELERVCRFIGYQGQPQWCEDIKPSNVSSERIRRFPLYRYLVDSTLATWVRRSLIPKQCREWVKRRLTMRQRPELSEETKLELENVFNRDLEILGNWLGESINCQNIKQVTAENSLNWVKPDA